MGDPPTRYTYLTQPKQVVTIPTIEAIPTIEVGKEGLEALTVWINVWFPLNVWTNEAKKKKCMFTVCWMTLIFGTTLNFFMALSVENYLNTLFLPSNV